MMKVLVVVGVQMRMMAILGEDFWRALDEMRRRFRFLLEAVWVRGRRLQRQVGLS
jgi:hypothetical protein